MFLPSEYFTKVINYQRFKVVPRILRVLFDASQDVSAFPDKKASDGVVKCLHLVSFS